MKHRNKIYIINPHTSHAIATSKIIKKKKPYYNFFTIVMVKLFYYCVPCRSFEFNTGLKTLILYE